MEERARPSVAFSHMASVAVISVVALFGLVAWQVSAMFRDGGNTVSAKNADLNLPSQASNPFGTINWQTPIDTAGIAGIADPEGIANIGANVVAALFGSYAALEENGSYTSETADQVAADIGASLNATISYESYTTGDIKTDPDTSHSRMLKYRDDMRIALEPLLENPGYELKIFAQYMDTGNAAYLTQMKNTASNYAAAVGSAAKITVPTDAVVYHVNILNSLSEFGAITARLVEHADDAFATAALLRSYDAAEQKMFTSFNALATFERTKQP